MIPCRYALALACIITAFCVTGCSREERKPASRAVGPEPDRALIEVVYDATRSSVDGGPAFRAPTGVIINSRKVVRTQAHGKIDFLEVRGSQQKGQTEAVIIFQIPATWLTTEQQNLHLLEGEMKGLTACSRKLILNEMGGKNQADDSCTMVEVTDNGRHGIEIRDAATSHIKMLMFPRN